MRSKVESCLAQIHGANFRCGGSFACLGDSCGCERDIVRQIHLAHVGTWDRNSYQSPINMQTTKKRGTISMLATVEVKDPSLATGSA